MALEGDPGLVRSGFDDLPAEPLALLRRWLASAEEVGVLEPRSLCLATADRSGSSSSRVLLLKDVEAEEIVFCSQGDSVKGQQLEENPWAAGNLWWRETVQQVSFAGPVQKASVQVSDQYFEQRSRSARAVATVSRQSRPMDDEESLRDQVRALVESDTELPRPPNWWAYRLKPHSVEFWQGSQDRFHRRLMYRRDSQGEWVQSWLQP